MGAKAKAIQRGFHRLGLLLAVPVLLLAGVIAVQQLREPTGPYQPDMPEGTVAFTPDRLDNLDRMLITDQLLNNVVAPDGFIVLGVPVERENEFLRFIDEGVETPNYRVFQLRDGREIVLGTDDESKLDDAAYEILRYEAHTGQTFPFNGLDTAADLPVRIAFAGTADPISPWPVASTKRGPDLTFVGVLALIAAIAYGFFAGVGWVVRGFFPDAAPSSEPTR